MSKKATKAAGNVFYEARMGAEAANPSFSSREGAAEWMGIDRTRLAKIELDALHPHPEEVVLMADAYCMPELKNFFCSQVCPIGKGSVPAVDQVGLDRVTNKLMSTMFIRDGLMADIAAIAGDGEISDEEVTLAVSIRERLEKEKEAIEGYLLMLEKRLREE